MVYCRNIILRTNNVSSTECKKKASKKQHVASNASTGARNSQPLIPAESIGSNTQIIITKSAVDKLSLYNIGALSLGSSQSRSTPLSQQPAINRQPAVSAAPPSAAQRPHSVQPKGGRAVPVAKPSSIQSSKGTLSHQRYCHIHISALKLNFEFIGPVVAMRSSQPNIGISSGTSGIKIHTAFVFAIISS